MKRLIDDLLDLPRITQGKLVLQREQVMLKTVVDDAIDACRPLITGKEHHLDVDIPSAPIVLNGDSAKLAQMLSNLLGNSCKFTPAGGNIVLRARCDGPDLTMSVSDDGSGIAPALLPRVFDLFIQGDHSRERSTDGLGIGLSLVATAGDDARRQRRSLQRRPRQGCGICSASSHRCRSRVVATAFGDSCEGEPYDAADTRGR